MLQDMPATADEPQPSHADEITIVRRIDRPGRKYHHLRSQDIVTSDARARELIKEYGRLVQKLVNEYERKLPRRQAMMDRDDLVATGNAMMIQAIESFDPSRNMKPSSWICFRVRQGLTKVIAELHGTKSANGERKAFLRGDQKSDRIFMISIFTPVGERSNGAQEITLLDTLVSDLPDVDEEVADRRQRRWLYVAINTVLNERERFCVFRLLDGESGEKTAADLGVTRQRVDQIGQKAIRKLRTHLESKRQQEAWYDVMGREPMESD